MTERGRGATGLPRPDPCSPPRSSSSPPSLTWGCCSRSPTTATSAPTPGAASSPIRTSTRCRSRSTAPRGPSTAAWAAPRRAASASCRSISGPTLMAALWWYVMLKIIRISKQNRITSIADFIASRYGKSHMLGGMVTIIAVFGIIPYIALQLKAISGSFLDRPAVSRGRDAGQARRAACSSATTRSTSRCCSPPSRSCSAPATSTPTERHEGLVAAIAFESVVKLLAFIAVGLFVTFWLYDGFADIFGARRPGRPQLERTADVRGRSGRLHDLGLAHVPVDGRHHVPAAPVPGDGGRERRRAPSRQGDLAVPALSARDQYVRAADHVRRSPALPGRARWTRIPSS